MMNIGILVAMEEELLPALNKFGNEVKKESYCGQPVYIFENNEKRLFVIKSGVGEIAAAATTQMLITRYNVELIINFGFVGSLKPEHKIGSLVIGRAVVHYDFDISPLSSNPKAKYTEMETVEIPSTPDLAVQAAQIASIPQVLIASSDRVVADSLFKKELVKLYNADVCEMESAAIALTAIRNGKVKTLFIKLVSDNADEHADIDFNAAIAKGTEKCGELIAALIEIL